MGKREKRKATSSNPEWSWMILNFPKCSGWNSKLQLHE